MSRYLNVHILKSPNIKMSGYLNVQIFKCHNIKMSRYYNIQILKCLDIACYWSSFSEISKHFPTSIVASKQSQKCPTDQTLDTLKFAHWIKIYRDVLFYVSWFVQIWTHHWIGLQKLFQIDSSRVEIHPLVPKFRWFLVMSADLYSYSWLDFTIG